MAVFTLIHKITKSVKKVLKKALPYKSKKKNLEGKNKPVEAEEVSEIDENLANEALEARLLHLIEESPASLEINLTGAVLPRPEEAFHMATFWVDDDNSWNFCRENFMSQRRSYEAASKRLTTAEAA